MKEARLARGIRTASREIVAPEMRVTLYDRVSSGLVALVLGLLLAVGLLATTWWMTRPQTVRQQVAVELVEFPGGTEDGAIDETLLVESPEDPVPDAAPDRTEEEVVEVEEMFESVTELADISAEQLLRQQETDAVTGGTPGSREGTGRRALGSDGGQSGLPPEQRWYIQFADQRNLDEYARQLDFFEIELGAILADGRLIYLSRLSQPRPVFRETRSGRNENRMYMSWQGGQLRGADQALFRKAEIEAATTRILHFYPPRTEALLLSLELEYAGRPVSEIRRTYFLVVPQGAGYRFQVTRQSYFQG
ncbi:MAG: hypothetical protein R3C12_24310 [Planctomycetaceae bacterium]|nr:hypothetical protein [Planctomycetaceae bacterium]